MMRKERFELSRDISFGDTAYSIRPFPQIPPVRFELTKSRSLAERIFRFCYGGICCRRESNPQFFRI